MDDKVLLSLKAKLIPTGLTMTTTADERQNKKNAQLCFAQKTLRFTKTMRMFWVAALKMLKKII